MSLLLCWLTVKCGMSDTGLISNFEKFESMDDDDDDDDDDEYDDDDDDDDDDNE